MNVNSRPDREVARFDVVVVGAGPAGLAAALRIKILAPQLSVVVLEKGTAVGSHIISGAVMDESGLGTIGLNGAEWEEFPSIPIVGDHVFLMTKRRTLRVPPGLLPPMMRSTGHRIVRLGRVCEWLASCAISRGVDIFPGMGASELCIGPSGDVVGVIAGEVGLDPHGSKTSRYDPGMELRGNFLLLAEGACGSLTEHVLERYNLKKPGQPQQFSLGIKEIWQIRSEHHFEGRVAHTFGWPLGNRAGGGGFIYHLDRLQVVVGLVTHLNYSDPYISPFEEFQRWKHHPLLACILEDAERVAFGARVISSGGLQALPHLEFPGGGILGCGAGMVDMARNKGIHNAMRSGSLAGEAVVSAIRSTELCNRLKVYDRNVRVGAIGRELHRARNVKPLWSRLGPMWGAVLSSADLWCAHFGCSLLPTIRLGKSDAEATDPAKRHTPISYPRSDGRLSFDRESGLHLASVSHRIDQPCHLRLADPDLPIDANLPEFAEPAQRYCPAGVYELNVTADGKHELVIHFENCLHCKTCVIKDPGQNITFMSPEGGGGPNYSGM